MEGLDREMTWLSVSSGSVFEWRAVGAGVGANSLSPVNQLGTSTPIFCRLRLLWVFFLSNWSVEWILSLSLGTVSNGQPGPGLLVGRVASWYR